jgi:serralysin
LVSLLVPDEDVGYAPRPALTNDAVRHLLFLSPGSYQMKNSRARAVRSNRTSRRFMLEKLEPRWCLAAAPAFESLPGANHTVLLDFDGHVVENTSWNSYYNQTTLTANPYDIDGNPSTFSATELARIEEAFHRVAEDFRPFNVNVTTIEPSLDRLQKSGSGDTMWGVRVIVTNESTMVTDPAEHCGCGGIAYINSFNSSSDLPVWVYTSGGKSVAEAASHEVGHALGLSHDGTSTASYYGGHGDGDIGWASIMGVGYYENVTQWDDGTYYDSNNGGSGANYNKGPDDLAVITTYNGFGYRPDDRGDSSGSASPLALNGTSVSDKGVIETSGDVDVYSFITGAGNVTLNVNSFLPGPNLDIQADLYDANGTLVTSSNPVTGLHASMAMNLAAGQYYLHIDGVGVGNPTSSTPTGYSGYASLGSYAITGSIIDPGQIAQLSVGDVIVNEANGTATFTVTLAGNASGDVTVNYQTGDGSARAPGDYEAKSGSLTFTSGGATTQTIVVPIVDDAVVEGVESFVVNLRNALGATIADGQGTATIHDNDASVSIGDASANEGNLATSKKNAGAVTYKDMVFTVTLSNSVNHNVVIPWSTADGTATSANQDYVVASGTLTITAGATSGTITIRAIGDNNSEPNETFVVNLGAVSGAAVTDGTGTGTILDDDSGGGRGKPNRAPIDELLIVEEMWYFEKQGHDHDLHDHHSHDDDSDGLAIAVLANSLNERDDDRVPDARDVQLVDEVHKLAGFASGGNRQSAPGVYTDDGSDQDSRRSKNHADSAADEIKLLRDERLG